MAIDLTQFTSGDWSLRNFSAFPRKTTVGNVEVVYNESRLDQFIFYGTVNLDIQETIDGIYEQAQAARADYLARV